MARSKIETSGAALRRQPYFAECENPIKVKIK